MTAKQLAEWGQSNGFGFVSKELLEQFAAKCIGETVADRCWLHENAQDELFEALHIIMGGKPFQGCSSNPNYKFPVVDCWVDDYDMSVEVILDPNTAPITREQADAMLALGFHKVYESQGERGVLWGASGGPWKCDPRQCRDFKPERLRLEDELTRLRKAIAEHHEQKADDRCIEDDDRLYAAAGLPPCDRRVGSKEEMLKNCARYIERRCQEGHWPTYRQLEDKIRELTEQAAKNNQVIVTAHQWSIKKPKVSGYYWYKEEGEYSRLVYVNEVLSGMNKGELFFMLPFVSADETFEIRKNVEDVKGKWVKVPFPPED